MGSRVTFYTVLDKQTNEVIFENRDAYYISQQIGISSQKIVGCANFQIVLDDRYIIYKGDALDLEYTSKWRQWFIDEWLAVQRMFHVKHA